MVAEGEGFEPPETLRPQRFSRPPQSSTLPSLRVITLTLEGTMIPSIEHN